MSTNGVGLFFEDLGIDTQEILSTCTSLIISH